MKGRIIRFPGAGCAYYDNGRCLYEETLNPGLDEGLRCATLNRLEEAYDDFLRQAEVFDLSEDKALRIWEERFSRLVRQQSDCQDYLPGDNDNFLGCVFALGDLCLKAFPRCLGQCPRFSPRPDNVRPDTPE
jgi:hypothetical protein